MPIIDWPYPNYVLPQPVFAPLPYQPPQTLPAPLSVFPPLPVTEDRIRKIIAEELAKLLPPPRESPP